MNHTSLRLITTSTLMINKDMSIAITIFVPFCYIHTPFNHPCYHFHICGQMHRGVTEVQTPPLALVFFFFFAPMPVREVLVYGKLDTTFVRKKKSVGSPPAPTECPFSGLASITTKHYLKHLSFHYQPLQNYSE